MAIITGCSKPDPQFEDCCNLTGQALPVSAQQVAHSPVTLTVHQIDPANVMVPTELADENTVPLAGPRFADDETDNIYLVELPQQAEGLTDLVVAARQGPIFAGATVVPATAAKDSTIVARPLNSSSRFEAEAYIRGLGLLEQGSQTLDDNLWSFWPRIAYSLPFAQAVRASAPDEATLDVLATLAVFDQQTVLAELAPLWPPVQEGYVLDPLEESLRKLAIGYDELEDQRLAAGLEQGALDGPWRADVLALLSAAVEEQTDAPTAIETMRSLLEVRALVRRANVPASISPDDPLAAFQLRKQESLVLLGAHAAVVEQMEEAFPCAACIPRDIVGEHRADFEDLQYEAGNATQLSNAWGSYKSDLLFYTADWLLQAVGTQAFDDFNLAFNNLEMPGAPIEQFVTSAETAPAGTDRDAARALVDALRGGVDAELGLYFTDPLQQNALAQIVMSTVAGAGTWTEIYPVGGPGLTAKVGTQPPN